MEFDKELLDKVYEMYKAEIFGFNEKMCLKCRDWSSARGKKLIHGPVPLFHIGKDYRKSEKRLLMVGMVAYGWGELTSKETWSRIFNNDREQVAILQEGLEKRVNELLFSNDFRYWRYLNYALENIYGGAKNGLNCIALSNFVHCNTGCTRDNLPQDVREWCISREYNGFIFKEIEIIKPTHVLALSIDQKYGRYLDAASDMGFKYRAIVHPSASGRSYEEFKEDIATFLLD